MLNYTMPMEYLMNGSLLTGVDLQLSNATGGLWYIVLFSIPVIMSYIKTENLVIPTVLTLWSITLYGYLIDPMMSTIATITLAMGIAFIALNALWRGG
jgi:hypothetical protein